MRIRTLNHCHAVFSDAATVESRLGESPLPAPEIAFADQQALAEYPLRHIFRQRTFVEFCLLNDCDLLDVLRKVQQNSMLFENVDADDVPVTAGQTHQRAQGIAQYLEPKAEQRYTLRSGWKPDRGTVGRHMGLGIHVHAPIPLA